VFQVPDVAVPTNAGENNGRERAAEAAIILSTEAWKANLRFSFHEPSFPLEVSSKCGARETRTFGRVSKGWLFVLM
jgi:hypothetical protein